MVKRIKVAALLSFVGGMLLFISGLMFAFSGAAFMVLVFGSNFLYLAFILLGSVVIIAGGVMVNNNPKAARLWGVVVLVLGAILEVWVLRAFSIFASSLVVFAAAFGAALAVVGGFFALTAKPRHQIPNELPVE